MPWGRWPVCPSSWTPGALRAACAETVSLPFPKSRIHAGGGVVASVLSTMPGQSTRQRRCRSWTGTATAAARGWSAVPRGACAGSVPSRSSRHAPLARVSAVRTKHIVQACCTFSWSEVSSSFVLHDGRRSKRWNITTTCSGRMRRCRAASSS